MQEIIEHFLQTKKSKETRRSYRADLVMFFRSQGWLQTSIDQFQALPFSVVCAAVTSHLESRRKVDQFTGKVRNSRSVNRYRAALSSFFDFLIWTYGYPKNPCMPIKHLPVPQKSNTPNLTEEELLLLLKFLAQRASKNERNMRDFVLVMVLFVQGLRRTEAVQLRWQAIDFQAKTIHLMKKGGAEVFIPIKSEMLQLLNLFRLRYGQPSEFVFHPVRNRRGGGFLNKPLTGSYLYEMIKKVAQQVLPNKKVQVHSFRTTFVTLGRDWGLDLIRIANGTTHRDLRSLRYYDLQDSLQNNAIHDMTDFLIRNRLFDIINL